MANFFTVQHDTIDLPRGATAQARRLKVSWNDRPIVAFSQSPHRAYLYPVFTPSGVAVTSEMPIDHPHHNSITIGADHFTCHFPFSTNGIEDGTYNFYINDVFQGRAPGRTLVVATKHEEISPIHLRVVQSVHWQSPMEWGAPQRRTVAVETRIIDMYPGEVANVFDIRSQLTPTEWDLAIGPTRHAYFTVRLADGLRIDDGGTIVDSEGRCKVGEITGQVADWVDVSGPGPHGHLAGLAVVPHPSASGHPWSIYSWGSIIVNPFLDHKHELKIGQTIDTSIRIIAHDGDPRHANIAEMAAELLYTCR